MNKMLAPIIAEAGSKCDFTTKCTTYMTRWSAVEQTPTNFDSREVKSTRNETSTSQTDVTREALVTSRKEVKPLVTSGRRV